MWGSPRQTPLPRPQKNGVTNRVRNMAEYEKFAINYVEKVASYVREVLMSFVSSLLMHVKKAMLVGSTRVLVCCGRLLLICGISLAVGRSIVTQRCIDV